MSGTVYIHSNKSNGKVYVGQTWLGIDFRGKFHKSDARGGKTLPFNYAVRKYGWDGFDHQEVAIGVESQTELDNLEALWIAVLSATDRDFGYNRRGGGRGGRVPKELRQRLSEAGMGHPVSEETRAKLRAATLIYFADPVNRECNRKRKLKYHNREDKLAARRLANKKYRDKIRGGPPLSKEELASLLSVKTKGHLVSIETREKIRQSILGSTWSPARRAAQEARKASKCG